MLEPLEFPGWKDFIMMGILRSEHGPDSRYHERVRPPRSRRASIASAGSLIPGSTMSDHSQSRCHSPGTVFGRIASAVAVSDLPRALAFYAGVLGMQVTFENGNPVGFVILKRDAAELHLTVARNHRAGTHNVAHLMVADATALHDHLVANGTRIVKGLRDADYGLRGFVFADPDGNRIDVGERL